MHFIIIHMFFYIYMLYFMRGIIKESVDLVYTLFSAKL